MFRDDYKESDMVHITMNDVTYEIFTEPVRYSYANRVEVDEDIKHELINIAGKFLFDGLKRICENKLSDDISIYNVCDIYNVNASSNSARLEFFCIRLMLEKPRDVIKRYGTDEYRMLINRMLPRMHEKFTELMDQVVALSECPWTRTIFCKSSWGFHSKMFAGTCLLTLAFK